MKLVSMVVLLTLAAGAVCAAEPTALPSLTIPDGLGINIHFAGRDDAQIEQIAAAGFRYVRKDFVWGSIEAKKGEYNFAAYDQQVDAFGVKGIRMLYILDYGNRHYDRGLAPRTDEGRAAFAAFAGAAAAHFRGRRVIWEVWNEPNRKFWAPRPDPEEYVKLVRAAYAAMKKADPGCLVVGPAVNRWDYGYIEGAFGAGLLECVDAVTLHPYDPAQPEDAEVHYARVRSLIRKYAPDKRETPILSGEWGYNTSKWGISLDRQADYLARMFLVNTMSGIPLSIWYSWHHKPDDPNNGEYHYGVVYSDFTEKPSYRAMKTLSTELGGYSYCRRIVAECGDDYFSLFRKGDDYRLAAWTIGDPHTVMIPLDVPSVAIVTQMGERSEVSIRNGMLSLDLTGSVQYIEPATPSRRWALEAAWDVTGRAIFERGLVLAKVTSRIEGTQAAGKLEVTGDGLERLSTTAGREVSGLYAWDGSVRPQIRASLSLEGPNQPVSRVVELDTSGCIRVDVLPPAGGDLLVRISRPDAPVKSVFEGKLVLDSVEGIGLDGTPVDFRLRRGQKQALLRIKITDWPVSVFSLRCLVLSAEGDTVLRTAPRRCQVVETFEGRPGDEVRGFRAEFDDIPHPTWSGRAMAAAGKVSLAYAEAPIGGPVETCAKLDYSLTGGKCSAQIVPVEPIVLPEQPTCLRAWIRGDGAATSLRLWIDDARREVFMPEYGLIDFNDWRCVEVDTTSTSGDHWGGNRDGRMDCPLSWVRLFMIDNLARNVEGSLYFGPLMLCYD